MRRTTLETLAMLLLSAAVSFAAERGAAMTPEQHIKHEARHELLLLPYYGVFDWLSFDLKGNEIILKGQVATPALKSDAASAVKGIEGIKKVVNNIEVLPTSPMDDSIRWREFRAIYFYPAMERYAIQSVAPIRIIVKNGNVVLKGVVDNEADKNLVNILANGVPGVFKVTNELQLVNRRTS